MAKADVLKIAIRQLKEDPEWKTFDQDDLYGEFESIIDALLYEKEYSHLKYENEDGHRRYPS